MVKPQIGIPMCLFLLIEKRFAELLIGGLLCIVGTAFTACVYGENTIELILQMAEIGKPYIGVRGHCDGTFLIFYLLRNFVGSWSLLLYGSIVLGLAMILAFHMNAREDVFVRALPLVASIPMWTYSQSHDGVVLVVAVIGIFSIIANRMKLKDKCFCLLVFAFAFFVGTWSFLSSGLGVFDPSGFGWIYRVVHFAFFLSIYLFAMSVIFRERNRKYVTSLKERAK